MLCGWLFNLGKKDSFMKINRHLSILLQEHYYFDEKHIGSSDNVEKSSKPLLFSQFAEKQKQVQQT